MKKTLNLLLAMLFSASLFANTGMRFEKMTWAQAKAKAAKENKMIFFDAYTTWCGPCKYLEEKVYTDASVASYFNTNYINVKFDMEDGEGLALAEEFGITSYPTLLFFSKDGKLVHKYIGAMEAGDFIQLGKDARDPSRQYFTLKERVESQKASTQDFMKWTQMAEEIEDADRGAVASTWLSAQGDLLANADLARATMLYSDVTEQQLSYLYANQEKIGRLLEWDREKVAANLYRKLFSLAIRKIEGSNRGEDQFASTIRKFDPSKIRYAEIDLSILRALYEDEDAGKAAELLVASLNGAGRIGIKDFCSLLIDYSPQFETEQVEQILNAIGKYSVLPAEKADECWLYLAQVICYSKAGEIDKAREAAIQAHAHPNTPEQYKLILAESFDIN